ncbi:MAG TPA: DsrE family protein [Thermoleophilia bacterium]|nr:DsrE family protein [Thermoleophilia bacterium]
MSDPDHLHILWTNADPLTAEKMVFMYAGNALRRGWWRRVTIIIWGSTAALIASDAAIRSQIEALRATGVEFSACRACAEELGVTAELEALGIEAIYWGEPLTELLRSGVALLTV